MKLSKTDKARIVSSLSRIMPDSRDDIEQILETHLPRISSAYDGTASPLTFTLLCMKRWFCNNQRRKPKIEYHTSPPPLYHEDDHDKLDNEFWLNKLAELAGNDMQMLIDRYCDGMTFRELGDKYGVTGEACRIKIKKITDRVKDMKLDKLFQRGEK